MATSPEGHPTPLTLAVKHRTDLERSQLFLQGRFDDVVKGMQIGERR
jgi:hypothetical protein